MARAPMKWSFEPLIHENKSCDPHISIEFGSINICEYST
jgi:hypothetical protein